MKQIKTAGSCYVMGQGIFILCLGMALCFLGSWMTSIKENALGYPLAAIVVAIGLLVPGILLSVEGMQKRLGICPKKLYLLMGLVSIVDCGLLWIVPFSYYLNANILPLLAGGLGVFWGMWFVRIAFHLHGCPGKAGAVCISAGITTFLGILIALQSDLSSRTAVTAVACYMLWIGIQILLVVPLLYRDWTSPTTVDAQILHAKF